MSGQGQAKTGQAMLLHDTRADKAIGLRIAGWSLMAIARELGYGSEGGVSRAVSRRRKRILSPLIAEERALQCERLDCLLKGSWSAAIGGDTKAVSAVLGIMSRRASVMGLDAADSDMLPRDEVQHTVTALVNVMQRYIPDEQRAEFLADIRRAVPHSLMQAKVVDAPVVQVGDEAPKARQELRKSERPAVVLGESNCDRPIV